MSAGWVILAVFTAIWLGAVVLVLARDYAVFGSHGPYCSCGGPDCVPCDDETCEHF